MSFIPGCSTAGGVLEIVGERELQNTVWGEQNHPNGTGPDVRLLGNLPVFGRLRDQCKIATDVRTAAQLVTFADILLEEVFEAVAEDDPAKLRAELVQVAAVAAQWIEAIDRADSQAAGAGEPEVGEPCTCTNVCPEDASENDCPFCRTLDHYDPCPIVGFGCGSDCGDDEHCTPEQQKAADG